MQEKEIIPSVNTNPLKFEELATCLASLASYMNEGDVRAPIDDFKRLFKKALREPASYSEITELTGQSFTVPDRRSSRGAWLLMNVEGVSIYGVHLQLWHRQGNRYSVPILDQIARVLQRVPAIDTADLQARGGRYNFLDIQLSLLDIVGVKDEGIWLVQTLHSRDAIDSAVATVPSPRLFRSCIFNELTFGGAQLSTLYEAHELLSLAFPHTPIVAMVLVLHPLRPDFELYRLKMEGRHSEQVVLVEDLMRTNSLAHESSLKQNSDCLLSLGGRLDNPLFKGLPPCRGGRTLSILACACARQIPMNDLLIWREADVRNTMKEDFGYDIPRDKVRHDLVDRVVGQGFMRKWGNEYSVSVKGMARYQYCLAKYTTVGSEDPEDVLRACVDQRSRIVARYGSL